MKNVVWGHSDSERSSQRRCRAYFLDDVSGNRNASFAECRHQSLIWNPFSHPWALYRTDAIPKIGVTAPSCNARRVVSVCGPLRRQPLPRFYAWVSNQGD